MKTTIQAFIVFGAVATLGAEELDFKIAAPVKVEIADYYMNGGSVSIVLVGGNGERRYVHRMTPEAPVEDGGGMLSFRYEKGGKSFRFSPDSADEKRMVVLLQVACVNTFWTSDYSALRDKMNTYTGRDWHTAFAMVSVLKQFDGRDNKPNKAEMATPRKPSD